MEIEAMTIKTWAGFIVAALAFAGSAVAAVEWCEPPASAWLSLCEPGQTREALLVVVPRLARSPAGGIEGLGARPPQVVVLTQQRCLATH